MSQSIGAVLYIIPLYSHRQHRSHFLLSLGVQRLTTTQKRDCQFHLNQMSIHPLDVSLAPGIFVPRILLNTKFKPSVYLSRKAKQPRETGKQRQVENRGKGRNSAVLLTTASPLLPSFSTWCPRPHFHPNPGLRFQRWLCWVRSVPCHPSHSQP